MLVELTRSWGSLIEIIAPVHDEPIFLSEAFIKGKMLPAIVVTAAVLTTIYLIAFNFVGYLVDKDASAHKRSRVCYQITNVLFNVFVGIVGIYFEYWVIPTLPIDYSTTYDKIVGHEEGLYLVSALQLGYQFWAIPVGLFFVRESPEMLVHHLAVVASTMMSGFLSTGFRYYTPFFYGIMELSSIPLSVMNTFKDNPTWIKKHPGVFAASRTIFGISYLFIRVFMCFSRWPVFLRDNFIVLYTRDWGIFKVFFMFQFCMAFFLNFMQLYWASLIISGLMKMIFPKKEHNGKKAKKEL
jgi:hypothetical protein